MSDPKDGPRPGKRGPEGENNRARYDKNIPEKPARVHPSLRAIAKAGEADCDLALDRHGRWWPVSPITRTTEHVQERMSHSAAFWLINMLSPQTADRWQAGECSEAELTVIQDWLTDVVTRDAAARPPAGVRHE